MHEETSQKRSFSRVAVRLPASARLIASPGSPGSAGPRPLFSFSRAWSGSGDELKLRKAGVPDPLVDYLQSMDAKLDMIVNLLNHSRVAADFPLDLDVVELSGAGLKFMASRPFAEGDLLEVVLTLRHYPLELAGAAGRIVRHGDEAGMTVWAMDFESIHERDQEAIVQFVLQEEREAVRKQRWT
jgi:hypothetical protein